MFKIVLKEKPEIWAMVESEGALGFVVRIEHVPNWPGAITEHRYSRNHWEPAPIEPVWQDVTKELKVEHIDGQYLQDMKHGELNIASVIGGYHFVKVEAYVKPIGGFVTYGSMRDFMEYLELQRTTLLRVERKAE